MRVVCCLVALVVFVLGCVAWLLAFFFICGVVCCLNVCWNVCFCLRVLVCVIVRCLFGMCVVAAVSNDVIDACLFMCVCVVMCGCVSVCRLLKNWFVCAGLIVGLFVVIVLCVLFIGLLRVCVWLLCCCCLCVLFGVCFVRVVFVFVC